MDDATEVLVIMLSSVLIIHLIVSIILIILVIKVVLIIKRLAEKAEHITNQAEAFGEAVQQAAIPVMAGRIVTTLFDAFKGKSKSKKK